MLLSLTANQDQWWRSTGSHCAVRSSGGVVPRHGVFLMQHYFFIFVTDCFWIFVEIKCHFILLVFRWLRPCTTTVLILYGNILCLTLLLLWVGDGKLIHRIKSSEWNVYNIYFFTTNGPVKRNVAILISLQRGCGLCLGHLLLGRQREAGDHNFCCLPNWS